MKGARGGTLGSSVFMRQIKEEERGKELWRGGGYRGHQEREMSWRPKRRDFPEAQSG